MRIELDHETDALYLWLRHGTVARTVELTDGVYLDLDRSGLVLGTEFLSVHDFAEIVGEHDGLLEIPERFDASIPA